MSSECAQLTKQLQPEEEAIKEYRKGDLTRWNAELSPRLPEQFLDVCVAQPLPTVDFNLLLPVIR